MWKEKESEESLKAFQNHLRTFQKSPRKDSRITLNHSEMTKEVIWKKKVQKQVQVSEWVWVELENHLKRVQKQFWKGSKSNFVGTLWCYKKCFAFQILYTYSHTLYLRNNHICQHLLLRKYCSVVQGQFARLQNFFELDLVPMRPPRRFHFVLLPNRKHFPFSVWKMALASVFILSACSRHVQHGTVETKQAAVSASIVLHSWAMQMRGGVVLRILCDPIAARVEVCVTSTAAIVSGRSGRLIDLIIEPISACPSELYGHDNSMLS